MVRVFLAVTFMIICGAPASSWAQWKPQLNGVQTRTQVQNIQNKIPSSFTYKVSHLSLIEINEAFRMAQSQPLPFEYIKDCCFERGYFISEKLFAKGISHLRLFVRGDKNFGPFKDKWNNSFTWEVHTAPGLIDSNNQIWIIDPALAKGAVPLQKWLSLFTSPEAVVTISMAHQFVYGEDDLNDSYAVSFQRPQIEELVSGGLLGCGVLQDAKNKKMKTAEIK